MSLKVLEGYLPRFFAGSYDIYKSKLNGLKVNKNFLKPEVNHEIKDILSKNMTREIEFYNFCRQRLVQQYDVIKSKWHTKIEVTNSTSWWVEELFWMTAFPWEDLKIFTFWLYIYIHITMKFLLFERIKWKILEMKFIESMKR